MITREMKWNCSGKVYMLNKKICLIGAFCVGKTALIQRYVYSIFSERYLSTLGVKISKKQITVDGVELTMVIWDLEGKDDYASVNFSYLRGAMGLLVVADGTRLETLETALTLRDNSAELLGDIPSVLIINKADLRPHWEITDSHIEEVKRRGFEVLLTSAKTGDGVEEVFEHLARMML